MASMKNREKNSRKKNVAEIRIELEAIRDQTAEEVLETGKLQAEVMLRTLSKKRKEQSRAASDEQEKEVLPEPDELEARIPAEYIEGKAEECTVKTQSAFAWLQERAGRMGVEPDAVIPEANNSTVRTTYQAKVLLKIETLRNDEIAAKSWLLYSFFAILLALGDIIMGNRIANEVFLQGEDRWVGWALGLFTIASGIGFEVVLNKTFHKGPNWLKNLLFWMPLVFITFMLAGFGLFQSTNLVEDFTNGLAQVPWQLQFAGLTGGMMGMTIGAPYSLALTIFVIRRKWHQSHHVKLWENRLSSLAYLRVGEEDLDRIQKNLAQFLKAKYLEGFQQGITQHLFPDNYKKEKTDEAKPASKDQNNNSPEANLIDRLRKNARDPYLSLLLFLFAMLVAGCEKTTTESKEQVTLICYGCGNQLPHIITKQKSSIEVKNSYFSAHWLGGRASWKSQPHSRQPRSLIDKVSHLKNDEIELNNDWSNYLKRVDAAASKNPDNAVEFRKEDWGTLLASASEQVNQLDNRHEIRIHWNVALPALDVLDDQALKRLALNHSRWIREERNLQATSWTGTMAKVTVMHDAFRQTNLPKEEYSRRLGLYLRRLLAAFGITIITLETENKPITQ